MILRDFWLGTTARPVLRRGTAGLLVLACAASFGALLKPSLLYADEALEAAKKRYEVGERDFVAGRYWQAAKAFEEAYALSRRIDLLYNAARAYDRGEYAVQAIEAYQTYLDSASGASDKGQIQKRIDELRTTLAHLQLNTKEAAFFFIDGHEYGRTPMSQPVDIDSGYHRIEVRKGTQVWAKEQQFVSGQTYKFDVELSSLPTGQGLADTTADDTRHFRPRTRRMAVSLGLGGAFDIAGNNFPPHQAAIYLGTDYRVVEKRMVAFDIALRLPLEFGQSWRNAGFLVGVRGALFPVPRLPLELVFELDLGLGVLDFTSSAPFSARTACALMSNLPSCTLYGFRVHPKLGIAYRFTSALELRGELLGLQVDLTHPIADPRLTVDLALAYRFL